MGEHFGKNTGTCIYVCVKAGGKNSSSQRNYYTI